MKKVLLFLLIILVTGCTTSYNLNITADNIKEEINISIPKSVASANIIRNQLNYNRQVYLEEDVYYNMNNNEDTNNYYIEYNYTHDISKYKDSSFLNLCYDSKKISNSDNYISISTGKRFSCIYMDDGVYMDNVDINITTDLNVLNNNADEINGNTYTWKINKNNYQNKPIIFEAEIQKPLIDKASNSPIVAIVAIVVSISLIVLIITVYLKRKHKKSNEI